MKKKTKALIITAAAALVLITVMLLLIFLPKGNANGETGLDEGINMTLSVDENGVHQARIITDKDGNIENNSYGTLMNYIPSQISTIHVENGKGTLDVVSTTPKNDKGETQATQYKIKDYEDFSLQTGIPDEIASAASKIDFSKVVTLEKNKSSEYGFDKPRATATVTYADKTKAVIYIGDNAPQDAGTYVKFGSGDAVYLVASDSVKAFDYGLTDLMSLEINNSAADSENSRASEITLSGSNFSKNVTLVPNTDGKNSASYKIITPFERYAGEKESSLVEGAIRGLFAESVKMVNPSESQLSSLGLAAPYAEVKAVYPDVTVDVISSKPDGEGKVNIMQKGGNVVYVMAAEKLPWVTTSYEKLLSEYVLNPKMTALSQVSVNDGKQTYDFTLSTKEVTSTDDDGKETTSVNTTAHCGKKEIEISYFSTLFQNIAYTQFADVSSEKAGGIPVLTVTYTYASDSASDEVVFYETGANRYAASLNGTVIGHVHKSVVNKAAGQLADVAANKQVDSVF